MVSLWDLATLLCVAFSVGGALGPARALKSPLGLEIVVAAVGLVIGLGFAWTMRSAGARAGARIRKFQGSSQERYFRLLYFAALLWIVFGFGLSALVSSALIRTF